MLIIMGVCAVSIGGSCCLVFLVVCLKKLRIYSQDVVVLHVFYSSFFVCVLNAFRRSVVDSLVVLLLVVLYWYVLRIGVLFMVLLYMPKLIAMDPLRHAVHESTWLHFIVYKRLMMVVNGRKM
jgi:hypothetical protein